MYISLNLGRLQDTSHTVVQNYFSCLWLPSSCIHVMFFFCVFISLRPHACADQTPPARNGPLCVSRAFHQKPNTLVTCSAWNPAARQTAYSDVSRTCDLPTTYTSRMHKPLPRVWIVVHTCTLTFFRLQILTPSFRSKSLYASSRATKPCSVRKLSCPVRDHSTRLNLRPTHSHARLLMPSQSMQA